MNTKITKSSCGLPDLCDLRAEASLPDQFRRYTSCVSGPEEVSSCLAGTRANTPTRRSGSPSTSSAATKIMACRSGKLSGGHGRRSTRSITAGRSPAAAGTENPKITRPCGAAAATVTRSADLIQPACHPVLAILESPAPASHRRRSRHRTASLPTGCLPSSAARD